MKLLYYFVFCGWYLLSLIPLRLLYVVSDVLYVPLYYLVRYRRKVVRKNLTASFPEKSIGEIIRIEKSSTVSFVIVQWKTSNFFPCRKNR